MKQPIKRHKNIFVKKQKRIRKQIKRKSCVNQEHANMFRNRIHNTNEWKKINPNPTKKLTILRSKLYGQGVVLLMFCGYVYYSSICLYITYIRM